jgi:hypothetical protein
VKGLTSRAQNRRIFRFISRRNLNFINPKAAKSLGIEVPTRRSPALMKPSNRTQLLQCMSPEVAHLRHAD